MLNESYAVLRLPDNLMRDDLDDNLWRCNVPDGDIGDIVEVQAKDGCTYRAKISEVYDQIQEHRCVELIALERIS